MSTVHMQDRPLNIFQRVSKSSPRSILVMAFVMLVAGVVALASGSMVLAKIMVYVVLVSMLCCVVLGLLNRSAKTKGQDAGN